MSWQAGSFVLLGLALAAGFGWYERKRPDARVVALVATLAAFAALGRIAFAALPNVKPTTDIVLIAGYALGAGPGFVVGSLAALSSNFFFGQGPWTPWQMAGWGITGVLGAWLALCTHRGPRQSPLGRWPLAMVCGVVGFAFTLLQDVGDWVNYSDHSLRQLAVYVGKGVGFDAVHAVGCVVFALAFGPAMARSVARFTARLEVRWRPPVSALPMLLLVCVSMATLPAPARSATPSAPVRYLVAVQNRDGGFGPSPAQPSDPVYAGWAALGLASAGTAPSELVHGGASLTAYLLTSAKEANDPGSVERTLLALRAAGVTDTNPVLARLVRRLSRSVSPDGSVSNQTNLTAFAVLALRSAGVPVPTITVRWLTNQSDADGGFNFATAGGTSDVDDTGAVLEALAGVRTARAARDRARAARFLRSQQSPSGGFPSQSGQNPNAQSTAWAVQGLLAVGAPSRPIARAQEYLSSLIASDGHIRYASGSDQTPVWVTAEALMALEGKQLPIAPVPASGAVRPGPADNPTLDSLAADVGSIAALALAPIGLG